MSATEDAARPVANQTARLIVVPVVRNDDGAVLICRMPLNRGVFPGQWALPGGGVEPGETIDEALSREVREELGVEVTSSRPLFFKDLLHEKTFPSGERRLVYMVFLLFECRVSSSALTLNDEFSEYAWVSPALLDGYDLNAATRDTFSVLGLLIKNEARLPAGP